jgi:hypothetical protein
MEKFLQDIVSTYWWVSVVIVGIIINIISAYIKPLLENRLGRVSEFWKKRQEARTQTFSRQVSMLKENSDLRSIYALREIRYRIRSASYLIFASIFFAMASWALGVVSFYLTTGAALVGAVCMIIAMDDHFDAIQVKKLVEASIGGISELRP